MAGAVSKCYERRDEGCILIPRHEWEGNQGSPAGFKPCTRRMHALFEHDLLV